MTTFQLGIPLYASNIVVKDSFGSELSFIDPLVSGSYQRLNVSLPSPLAEGQSLSLVAQYTGKEVAESGEYYLVAAEVFPYFEYYVDSATVNYYLPTGANLLSPSVKDTDQITLTNRGNQQILTVSAQGISFEDNSIPNNGIISYGLIALGYSYNIIWSSLEATIIAFIVTLIAVIIVFLSKKTPSSASERSIQKVESDQRKLARSSNRR
jgi:hypothetical protein